MQYGWCFDAFPRKNSLLLGFGKPALSCRVDLVSSTARLAGEGFNARFGDSFPSLRFLDTMGGGIVVPVHPLTE